MRRLRLVLHPDRPNCVDGCRLTTLEVIRQNEGPSSSLRLQVAAVSCDECGAIPWDELQVSRFPQSIRLQIVFYFTINFLVLFLRRIEELWWGWDVNDLKVGRWDVWRSTLRYLVGFGQFFNASIQFRVLPDYLTIELASEYFWIGLLRGSRQLTAAWLFCKFQLVSIFAWITFDWL